jgi:uncharacterized phage protein gp47/JayE
VANGFTLSSTARALTRSSFFGKDFDSYVAEIVDFLKLRFGTEVADNWVASEQGVMLIEGVAFALSTAAWYGDRQIDDTNLIDVRIRAAAAIIARQLGYEASGAVAPAVSITMTLAAPQTARLTVERGRNLQGPSGLIFETTEEVVFDVGEVGPKTFAARQGQTYEETFTSNGARNQLFLLTTIPADSRLAYQSVIVYVAAIEWSESPFLTFEQTDQFEVLYAHNPPRLLFGDGVAGNIPPKDAEIRVQFFATRGTAGAVPANTVTTFIEPLVAGLNVVTATLVHDEPSTPGSDVESIRSIKTNAPLVTQAADRSVTQTDLDGWINSFTDPVWGSVAIGRANTPRSVDQDAQALTIIQQVENCGCPSDVVDDLRTYWDSVLASNHQANIVVVQILSADSVGRYVSASAGLAAALESFLDSIAVLTTKARVTDGAVNLLSVDMSADIKVTEAYESTTAREAVKAAVTTAIENELLGRAYGESLRISDLYNLVDNVTGVDYAHLAVTNYSTRVNTFGDLPIEDYEVITLGQSPLVTIIT